MNTVRNSQEEPAIPGQFRVTQEDGQDERLLLKDRIEESITTELIEGEMQYQLKSDALHKKCMETKTNGKGLFK